MGTKHGKLMRGFEIAGTRNKTFDGIFGARFGRLFDKKYRAKFGDTAAESLANLTKLADKMVSPFDLPKDGPDGEESGIPSLYTYFGQFVDHDLTFDPSSSFQKQKAPRHGRFPHSGLRPRQRVRPGTWRSTLSV